jgi:DNA-binding response OmpR family regulator
MAGRWPFASERASGFGRASSGLSFNVILPKVNSGEIPSRMTREEVVLKTILVVDDEVEILSLVQRILTREDYRIITAKNAEEVFAILEKESVDLILLDVMMPAVDGFEVCRRLKTNARTQPIPIVMLTVLATNSDIRKAFDLGAAAYLIKPFDPDILDKEIKNVLQSLEKPR